MAYDGVRCFGCQQYGHIERYCPDKNYAAELGDGDKPPWCGGCDRKTRLVYFLRDGTECARRCNSCHPSGHLLPAEFRRCGRCGAAIYEWDRRSECGSHEPVGNRTGSLIATWQERKSN